MVEKKVYIIPGKIITSLECFYDIIGEIINGPGGYFGRNLDSFQDCLRGGFGTPEEFIIKWEKSDTSRKALGYTETIRQLEKILKHCHPTNKKKILDDLEFAKRKEGSTVFDWLVDIINEAKNVEFMLK